MIGRGRAMAHMATPKLALHWNNALNCIGEILRDLILKDFEVFWFTSKFYPPVLYEVNKLGRHCVTYNYLLSQFSNHLA